MARRIVSSERRQRDCKTNLIWILLLIHSSSTRREHHFSNIESKMDRISIMKYRVVRWSVDSVHRRQWWKTLKSFRLRSSIGVSSSSFPFTSSTLTISISSLDSRNYNQEGYGEFGFQVALTERPERVVISSPGSFYFRGGVHSLPILEKNFIDTRHPFTSPHYQWRDAGWLRYPSNYSSNEYDDWCYRGNVWIRRQELWKSILFAQVTHWPWEILTMMKIKVRWDFDETKPESEDHLLSLHRNRG